MDKDYINQNWDRIEEKYKIIKGKIPTDNEFNFDAWVIPAKGKP
jgi:hypothetical protein